jgi:hypothetical protein
MFPWRHHPKMARFKILLAAAGRFDPLATPSRDVRYLREAVIHCALGDRNPRAVPAPQKTLTLSVAPDCRMNFAPVQVEHAHGDGAGRPVDVGDKPDRANGVSRIGDPGPIDFGEALDRRRAHVLRDELGQPREIVIASTTRMVRRVGGVRVGGRSSGD